MPGNPSSKKEWSLAEVIPFLCRKPRIYVLNGTFHEVYTFIEGIHFGRSPDSPFVSEWSDFHIWLLKKGYISGGEGACHYLRKHSDDDEVLLRRLAELFDEFCQSQGIKAP